MSSLIFIVQQQQLFEAKEKVLSFFIFERYGVRK